MNRFPVLLLLMLVSFASATKWQYATWRSYSGTRSLQVWNGPFSERFTSLTLRQLATTLKLKNMPRGTAELTEMQFLNRLGLSGWELVDTVTSGMSKTTIRVYYFKRVVRL
ncbi:hypothetical protein [Deinococcus yavapaiensis]|uniref:Uncharacterized protein n=1 Tax=Deinococcus yavapaiensis KR-236 TaxID=694435 RepID=A0A318S9F3_9DEIO|nr:hypothetical protein [Deinococcus yavapaiensis]PYE54617.1 hypothetical protein DES52_105257 [Deinococcus yavapaiensis KR-236]